MNSNFAPTINDAFWAIQNNDIPSLKKAIWKGDFDINEENEFGETLLGSAIWLRNVPAVRFLCTCKQINVNKTTKVYLGENARNPELVVSPLELASCIFPKISYGRASFLDSKLKDICTILVAKNAKMPFAKYRNKPEFKQCLLDLKEVVNSVNPAKTSKTDIQK